MLLLGHLQVPHRGDRHQWVALPHHRDHRLLQHRAVHLNQVDLTQGLILVSQEVALPHQDLLWEALSHHHKAIQAIQVRIRAMVDLPGPILELRHI